MMGEVLKCLRAEEKVGRVVLKLTLGLLAAVLLAVALLTLSYCLPKDKVYDHVAQSVDILESEGIYPRKDALPNSLRDNFSDSVMLGSAFSHTDHPAYYDAMMVPNYVNWTYGNPLGDLINYVRSHESVDTSDTSYQTYARYWHGYLIFLTPALSVFNCIQIRTLNLVLQTVMVLCVCWLLWRKGLRRMLLPYILTLMLLRADIIHDSLQFSSMFYLFNIASIFLLLFFKRLRQGEGILYFFFCIGMGTSFLDLLTYPLVTWGIPAVMALALCDDEKPVRQLARLIKSGVAWVLGYVGFWSCKWLIGSLLTGNNIFDDALNTVATRTSDVWDGEPLSVGKLFYSLFHSITLNPAMLAALILVAVLFVVTLKLSRRQKHKLRGDLPILLPYAAAALAPFAWYICTVNHSYIHYFYTHKSLAVTAFAGMAMLTELAHQTRKRDTSSLQDA